MPPQNPQDPQNQQYPPNPYGPPNQTPNPAVPQGYVPTPPPAESGSPYDFFLAEQQKAKKSLLPKQSSGFGKIIFGAVALFVVLIVLAVALNISRGSKKTSVPGFSTIIQDQQEIIRVSTLGAKNVTTDSLQNFAATAIATTTSAQQDTINFVQKNGGSVDSKALAAADDHQTDAALTAALAAGSYDATFKTTMQSLLTNYEATIQRVETSTVAQSQHAILDTNLSAAQLLDKMLNE